MIPKQMFRIWVGDKKVPDRFEGWWQEFVDLHPTWNTFTIGNLDEPELLALEPTLMPIYEDSTSMAGRSDILRWIALYHLGGVYVDVDTLPVKAFDPLLEDDRPFAGHLSRNILQNSVLGSPPRHQAVRDLLDIWPQWYEEHKELSPVYSTGPRFLSAQWMDREDVRRLPKSAFHSLGRISYVEFRRQANKNPDAYCAHYGMASWWAKKKQVKSGEKRIKKSEGEG